MREPHELRVAGYLPPEHRQWVADLEARYRFRYEGAPDREGKIRFLQSVDVLSVPSEYIEPKGLFLLEAMANGTPAVQPRTGTYPEIMEKTKGGVLVEPGSTAELANALDALAKDREKLRQLGRAAAEGVRLHYSIEAMVSKTVEVYGAVHA
jgi:glycosyltransferase involved in cell wall biosynthesis